MTADGVCTMNAHGIATLGDLEIRLVIIYNGLLIRDQLRAIRPKQMKFFEKADLATSSVDQIYDLMLEQIQALTDKQIGQLRTCSDRREAVAIRKSET